MSKLSQLEEFRRWRLPTPRFCKISYADFRRGRLETLSRRLHFPLAVRSTYAEEDGDHSSMAGRFITRLNVEPAGLREAVAAVFASYPDTDGQYVILQEMLSPEYSGVLFAFRNGVWKVEIGPGQGEELVGGRRRPATILLPRFNRMDARLAAVADFWDGAPWPGARRALIRLSSFAGVLLRRSEAVHGLDIEFAICGDSVYLLQSRPVTTPSEAEQVLTSANHKEILPPRPSRLMTALISSSGEALFDYYRRLDSGLRAQSFVREAEGMPWINLSALLDAMVYWGLPTRLVCKSVGAEDSYRVGFRPWRALEKIPVFLKVLGQQRGSRRNVRRWLRDQKGRQQWQHQQRELLWQEEPLRALELWEKHFRGLYVGLVTQMQMLTGAMSGPVHLLDRMGLLAALSARLRQKSKSTDFFRAFRDLQNGRLSRTQFLQQFGHRGFYESDLSRPRFADYSEEDWRRLLHNDREYPASPPGGSEFSGEASGWSLLLYPVVRLIHTRETLRHEVMHFFQLFRRELEDFFQDHYGKEFNVWDFRPSELKDLLRGKRSSHELMQHPRPAQSGWDLNTFLCNQEGRRLPLDYLANVDGNSGDQSGIGIYPGRIRGKVWRVREAGLGQLQPPPFSTIILVADALDPGWIPFFARVDGVISYTGGLLSHASIILRESRVPAITQLPPELPLHTGDTIEMDGRTGEVRLLERRAAEA